MCGSGKFSAWRSAAKNGDEIRIFPQPDEHEDFRARARVSTVEIVESTEEKSSFSFQPTVRANGKTFRSRVLSIGVECVSQRRKIFSFLDLVVLINFPGRKNWWTSALFWTKKGFAKAGLVEIRCYYCGFGARERWNQFWKVFLSFRSNRGDRCVCNFSVINKWVNNSRLPLSVGVKNRALGAWKAGWLAGWPSRVLVCDIMWKFH